MNKIKIQLFVSPSTERVSTKFHIFIGNKSVCKKFCQDTEFYETDLIENINDDRTLSEK